MTARRRAAGLPPLLEGPRRRWMLGLVLCGIAVAGLSAATARLIPVLSHEPTTPGRLTLIAVLLGLVVGVVGIRMLERRLAERLGQDYVHEVRLLLVRGAVSDGPSPSLGVTVARTTNDLNSVKNWVTMGVAGVAAGVPLIVVLTVVLWIMSPVLAAAVIAPLLMIALLLGLLARPTFGRARDLRRSRGRLAGQVTDTVNAAVAIHAAGGQERELGRVDALGREVAAAAVARATLAGALRASAFGAASVAAVAVAGAAAFGALDRGLVAAALTVVGMIAAPVHDLGRIVEYRQSYRAARVSLAPGLAAVRAPGPATGAVAVSEGAEGADGAVGAPPAVRIGAAVLEGIRVPAIELRPGSCVLVGSADHAVTARLFRALIGLGPDRRVPLEIDGRSLATMSAGGRRRRLGYAEHGLALERGPLMRAIRYRVPDASAEEVVAAVAAADLQATIAGLPDGDRTRLRRGGEPLASAARAKVQLARAVLGTPRLLLLDRIDADLDTGGRAALRRVIAGYPGVVIVATDHPELLPAHEVWALHPVETGLPEVREHERSDAERVHVRSNT